MSDFEKDHEHFKALGLLDKPHGWIQWKGTDVCMDLHCTCGVHGHIDAGFAYYVKCTGCGQVYLVSAHVALLPGEPPPNFEPIPFSEEG